MISLQRTHGRGERRRERAGRAAAAHLLADAVPPGRSSSRALGRQGPPSQPLPRARRRDGRRFPLALGASGVDACVQSRAHIALCTSMCSSEDTDFCMPRVCWYIESTPVAVERRGTPDTAVRNVYGFATRKNDLIRSRTRQTVKLATAVTKGPVLAAPVGPCRLQAGSTGCLGQTNINTVPVAIAVPSECPAGPRPAAARARRIASRWRRRCRRWPKARAPAPAACRASLRTAGPSRAT